MTSVLKMSASAPSFSHIVNTIDAYLELNEEETLKVKEIVSDYFTSESLAIPYEMFRKLGKVWWKQFIDAKYHHLGHLVFDLGLHKGFAEPGFYLSLENTFHLAGSLLKEDANSISVEDELPNTRCYHEVHKCVCAHFKGRATNTYMKAAFAGKFTRADSYQRPIREVVFSVPGFEVEQIKPLIDFAFFKEGVFEEVSTSGDAELLKTMVTGSDMLLKKIDKKIKKINKYIADKSRILGASCPVARLKRKDDSIGIKYMCQQEELEALVEKIFTDFKKQMIHATSLEERKRSIADLFQMLEWIHPYPDGQGRTDLIFLAMLLCKYGANPSILDEPYLSSFSLLDEWCAYMNQGIERWQQEVALLEAP